MRLLANLPLLLPLPLGEGQAVGQQLPEGGVQVFAGGFVLPRKHAAHKDIGIAGAPADDVAFFFEPVALGAAGLGHVQQLAQVEKVALRALFLVQVIGRTGMPAGRAPFGDEVLRGHGVSVATQQHVQRGVDGQGLRFGMRHGFA